jgi:hypothetical protein
MSRTYRKLNGMHPAALRYPHTFNEIRSLNGILNDDDFQEYEISKLNRIKSRQHLLPTCWDDVVISGYREIDYK